jgi:Fe-S-cluster containining protein
MMQQSSRFSDSSKLQDLFETGTRKDFVAEVRQAMRQILAKLQVEDHYEQVISEIKREPGYRDLNNTWEKLEPAVRRQKWQELMERLVQLAYATRPYCLRCGECCRQGSPSLHHEDLELLDHDLISIRQIYTLRQGEPVKFNIEGRLGFLPGELIKIKEDPESRNCIFLVRENNNCTIYHHRPLQCRVQACWDPEKLEKLYHQKKLTRRHLLREDQPLLELLEAHNERCSFEKLDSAFKKFHETGDEKAIDQVLDILRQDMVFRDFVKTKLDRDEEELDFLLGRPLMELVRAYGVRVEKDENNVYHLVSEQ